MNINQTHIDALKQAINIDETDEKKLNELLTILESQIEQQEPKGEQSRMTPEWQCILSPHFEKVLHRNGEEASDEDCELAEKILNAAPPSSWISMDTKQPEHNARVIFILPQNDKVTSGMYLEHDQWDREYIFVSADGGFHSNVTHWQPAPPRPRKEGIN